MFFAFVGGELAQQETTQVIFCLFSSLLQLLSSLVLQFSRSATFVSLNFHIALSTRGASKISSGFRVIVLDVMNSASVPKTLDTSIAGYETSSSRTIGLRVLR